MMSAVGNINILRAGRGRSCVLGACIIQAVSLNQGRNFGCINGYLKLESEMQAFALVCSFVTAELRWEETTKGQEPISDK